MFARVVDENMDVIETIELTDTHLHGHGSQCQNSHCDFGSRATAITVSLTATTICCGIALQSLFLPERLFMRTFSSRLLAPFLLTYLVVEVLSNFSQAKPATWFLACLSYRPFYKRTV